MNNYLKATPLLLLALVGAGSVRAEVDSWDAEELGKTYALTELCIDLMRSKHDWKLDRDLKKLLATTQEEVEESHEYHKKINRGYKDATSDFRQLKKDAKEETCYGLVNR